MKNMGLSRLRLAAPFPLDDETVRARAVHGVDIWDGAEFHGDLGAAVADCSLVIGTTRRYGRKRTPVTMGPGETAAFLRDYPGRAALVFGNERTGLEQEELLRCNMASHIPASASFPSLNLSHAVQIYAYELFRVLGPAPALALAPKKGSWVPLDQAGVAEYVRQISSSLSLLGFYQQPGRERQEQFFRDLFARSGLTDREGQYLASIFAKAARLALKQTPSPFWS
jgi:tRNA/rRNA methyltransferase/tRNA (cytidine32/uridine32-2'-O)-methyltransferase